MSLIVDLSARKGGSLTPLGPRVDLGRKIGMCELAAPPLLTPHPGNPHPHPPGPRLQPLAQPKCWGLPYTVSQASPGMVLHNLSSYRTTPMGDGDRLNQEDLSIASELAGVHPSMNEQVW